ncbi:ACP S-malonyltransferase [Streptomyces boncukensis]|uniref:Malonyl CoA-acyl carrier protein transacylase n=1 Tax=Streptomyces boncukensis TaxID=2711219 RepID=A0A6G4X537_9ACTN|nr:ACP S-malonyltransferase [Streptomyces boncukensis]NGO72508.1 ACP S-malonyltransferase [Streptomyces boncukensis]
MTVIHLFPGQGSHRTGMGRELFERYPHLVRRADAVLGRSVADLCLTATAGELADTRNAQPAMYVVDALSYVDRIRSGGAVPDALAGHSLGEYAALYAAGAYDFATGLELVCRRAELMAEAGPGAMLAVLGTAPERVRAVLDGARDAAVDVANLNAPDQTVVSGPADAIDAVRADFESAGARTLRLPVSGPFHSRHMAPAAGPFAAVLRRHRFGRLRIPVVANVTARPYRDGEVAELLVRQLTEPVRWTETLSYLLGLPDPDLHEIGPGTVLSGLTARIRQEREPASAAPVPART